MPYISKNDGRREALRNGDTAKTAGELNYQMFYFIKLHYLLIDEKNSDFIKKVIKKLVDKLVDNFLTEKPNYQKYNDMTGALIRCAKEIERRLNYIVIDLFTQIINEYDDEIAKYEDLKIVENGDVE
jgi:hypothetical protein